MDFRTTLRTTPVPVKAVGVTTPKPMMTEFRTNSPKNKEKNTEYSIIPERKMQSTYSLVRRFINDGGNQSITLTIANLCAMCVGVIATSATAAVLSSNVFRIKYIKIWSMANSDTLSATTVTASWVNLPTATTGVLASIPQGVSDTTGINARYAHITLKPPKNSNFAGKWWYGTATADAVALVIPAESIMDVSYEAYHDYLGIKTAYATAISGATAGTWYSVSINSLTPQGVNVI